MDIRRCAVTKLSPYETGGLTDSIFFILMARTTPIHGFGIMKAVQETTEQSIDIDPATMYTSLAVQSHAIMV